MTNDAEVRLIAKVLECQIAQTASINKLIGVVETGNLTLAELVLWMKEPPSSDLPDLIRELVKAVERQTSIVERASVQQEELAVTVTAMGARISALRDQIAKVVK